MAELVTEIVDLDVVLSKSNPPVVGMKALGQVPTTGWTDPELAARIYVTPPADGVQEFDFMATPPSGPAGEMISHLAAEASFVKPDWCKGVRVYAQTNKAEKPV
jgi:hypothetical protein